MLLIMFGRNNFQRISAPSGAFFLSNCTLGALIAPKSGACTELLRANYVYDMEPGHTAATGKPPAKAQQPPYTTASGTSL